LVDRARERRQIFAEHYGIRDVFDSVEDLLTETVPEIVAVIFPVQYTPDAVIACAEAGVKAIWCEKPIAVGLRQADEMVRVCRERGAALGCGTALWEIRHLSDIAPWVQAGHIGRLAGAAIPGGLPKEVSGAGCVQLTMMRLLTGMEVEWVEGWTLPPEQWKEGWDLPPGVKDPEIDCPAYGRLGLSGGMVCEVPEPRPDRRPACRVSVRGDNGRVWLCPESVLIQGRGAASTPVYPEFLSVERPESYPAIVENLMRAVDTGQEVACSGHDYRQALEIAVALKVSAQRNHERVHLPLQERDYRIYPRPYRFYGGDVVGWESIGHKGPPGIE
jgi:predicted dehydrogenase